MQFVYLAFLFCASVACDSLVNGDDRKYIGDDDTEIVRPCSVTDLNCIRRFFADHSNCVIAMGPVPDPYKVQSLEMPVPHGNATFTWVNADVKGLRDGEIREFYINKATNKLVLEVEFRVITVSSTNSIAAFHRKGMETIELEDYAIVSYKLVSMTMTVPINKEIEMSKAQVYTYIGDAQADVNIGKNFFSTDIQLQNAYNTVLGDMSTTMKEIFVCQGPVYFYVYFDSNICRMSKQNLPILDFYQ